MIRLSVVLPIYNEEEALPSTLQTLSRALEEKIPGEWEIVAVNDGSADGSLLILQRCASEIPSLKVVSYEKNRGKGGALKEGMCRAEGRFVLFTDCDLAYGVEEIFVFLSAFETEGTQLIVGSRSLSDDGYTGYSALRRMMSKVYFRVVKTVAGIPFSDSQCGIKGFEQSCAFKLFSELETYGFAFDLEILLKATSRQLSYREMPVKVLHHGKSSVHPAKDAFQMLRDLRKIKKRMNEEKKPAQA